MRTGRDIGTQKKYDAARKMRVARKAGFEHSPVRAKNTGYRYLTEAEMNEWFVRVNNARWARMKVMR